MLCPVLALAKPLNANRYNGSYIGIIGGPAFMPSLSEKDSSDSSIKKDMKTGYIFGVETGWKINRFRLALELVYTKSDIKNLKIEGATYTDVKGNIKAYPLLFNAYYDLDFFSQRWIPYIGIGIGSIHVKEDTRSTFNSYEIKEDADVIGAQGIVGMMYHINQAVSASLDYRYLITEKKDYDVTDNLGQSGTLSERYKNQMVMLGLYYHFG